MIAAGAGRIGPSDMRDAAVPAEPPLPVDQRAELYELLRSIQEPVELDRLLPEIATRTRALFAVESSAVLLYDATADELWAPAVAAGEPPGTRHRAAGRGPADRGIAGWVFRHGAVELVADVTRDPRWVADVDGEPGTTTRSLLCAPLRGRQEPLGVLSLRDRRHGAFTAADVRMVGAVADDVGRAIDTARRLAAAHAAVERLRGEVEVLQHQLAWGTAGEAIIGHSPAMRRVLDLVRSAAPLAVPVLITGESGAGKELVARAIHAGGPRRTRPFVAVDCGALSETLLESELFGHGRGACAGAVTERRGLLETASGGTVFVDAVGDLPAALQAKLLRTLDVGEMLPMGERTPRAVDVRVVAASVRDLAAAVRAGTFRADLLARLSALPIAVPPLRARHEDLPLLAIRALARCCARSGKTVGPFTTRAMARLATYDWPGNVRELQNEIERAVTLVASGAPIDVADLSPHVVGSGVVTPALPGLTLRHARGLFERDFLAEALAQHGGNASRTARALGISRVMLHKKLRAYGMRRRDTRPTEA